MAKALTGGRVEPTDDGCVLRFARLGEAFEARLTPEQAAAIGRALLANAARHEVGLRLGLRAFAVERAPEPVLMTASDEGQVMFWLLDQIDPKALAAQVAGLATPDA